MKRTENTSKCWPESANRYVCFIDIMGFKDMVLKKKHSEVYNVMKNIVAHQELNSSVDWNDIPNLTRTTTYSDSIVIYTPDDSDESLVSIINTIAGLSDDLFLEGIPFKGAFSQGMMTCDFEKSIYFGQPLIDSYLLQEELYFYGVVIHCTAQKKIDSLETTKLAGLTMNYLCPFKKGKAMHRTIPPLSFDADEDQLEDYEKLLESIFSMTSNTSGHLRIYIDSTIEYIQSVREDFV